MWLMRAIGKQPLMPLADTRIASRWGLQGVWAVFAFQSKANSLGPLPNLKTLERCNAKEEVALWAVAVTKGPTPSRITAQRMTFAQRGVWVSARTPCTSFLLSPDIEGIFNVTNGASDR